MAEKIVWFYIKFIAIVALVAIVPFYCLAVGVEWLKKTKKNYRKPLFNSSFYLSIAILVFILWFVTNNP